MGFSSGSWGLKSHQHTGVGDGGIITAGENIELASGKAIKLNKGTGEVALFCATDTNQLNILDHGETADRDIQCKNVWPQGTVDGVDITQLSDIALGYVISVGDTLVYSYDEEANTTNTGYTVLKRILITKMLGDEVHNATIRIKFDVKSLSSGQVVTARIYKNGGAVGTEQSVTSTAYATKSEDLAFAEGDYLEIYGKRVGSGGCYVENLRIYVTKTQANVTQVLANDDADAVPFQADIET